MTNFKHIEEQIAKLHDANYILAGGGIIKLSPKDVADTLQQLLDVARAAREKSCLDYPGHEQCERPVCRALAKLEEHGP